MTQAIKPTADQELAQAEAEADEAAQLVAALEIKAEQTGDQAVFEELVEQERLSRFARFRASAMRKKAEAAREAQRQKDIRDLRVKIRKAMDDDGAQLVPLLESIEAAMRAFIDAAATRNTMVKGLRDEAMRLSIPPAGNATTQGISWREHGTETVILDGSELSPIRSSSRYLTALAEALGREHSDPAASPLANYHWRPSRDELYAELRREA